MPRYYGWPGSSTGYLQQKHGLVAVLCPILNRYMRLSVCPGPEKHDHIHGQRDCLLAGASHGGEDVNAAEDLHEQGVPLPQLLLPLRGP